MFCSEWTWVPYKNKQAINSTLLKIFNINLYMKLLKQNLINVKAFSISHEISTVFYVLYFVMLFIFVAGIMWSSHPYPSGLLHWHRGNHMIAPVPVKQSWRIWVPNCNKTEENKIVCIFRDHSGYGISQWETTLQCGFVSHWLTPYPQWPLHILQYVLYMIFHVAICV